MGGFSRFNWPQAWRGTGSVSVQAIAFSGFGDAPIVFLTLAGASLTPPSTNPNCGSGCDGFVKLAGNGWGVVGGNAPNFGTTGSGIFSQTFATATETPALLASTGFSGGADGLGNFYGVGSAKAPASGRAIQRFNASGAATGAWITDPVPGTLTNGAPSFDGTKFYYVDQVDRATVLAWDLVNDVALGVFVNRPGYRADTGQTILALSNGDVLIGWGAGAVVGDVVHYDAAGAVLHTYALPSVSANLDPTCVALAPGGLSIVVGFYNGASITPSGVTIAQITLGTGVVIGTPFDPSDGAFEFDGAFAIGPLGSSGAARGSWANAWRE